MIASDDDRPTPRRSGSGPVGSHATRHAAIASAPSKAEIASSTADPDLGQAVELGADMGLQHVLHQRCLNRAVIVQDCRQFRGHQGCNASWPGHPASRSSAPAGTSAPPPGLVDQIALELLQTETALLGLQHLVRSLGLQKGGATTICRSLKPLFLQSVTDCRDSRLRHRLASWLQLVLSDE